MHEVRFARYRLAMFPIVARFLDIALGLLT